MLTNNSELDAEAFRAFEALCVEALARREHSRAELSAKAKDSIPAEVIEAVLNQLAEKGWQSDERFAQTYIRSKAMRGDGPLKIRQSLKQRGIDESLIRDTLESEDWFARASEVYAKKYAQPTKDAKERAKRQRFLAQRGFTFEQYQAAEEDNQ
ncbi:regulatory protein RecX [Suttonella ornithocola]|uniref:Regulatory protein RecX n=1 Tax=Suttonella ornithocola TaxID=279832 RepID=A0A380MMS7_9GAMM|nr:regulatory protein RecX [Suttonella ornithocola]SUO93356.1 Regulatory protein recX [Suttonella ornithocola]